MPKISRQLKQVTVEGLKMFDDWVYTFAPMKIEAS